MPRAFDDPRRTALVNALFDRDLTAVCELTPDGTLLDCNGAFARLLGFETAGELSGAPFKQLAATACGPSGTQTAHELSIRRRDGTTAWMAARFAIVDAEPGRPVIVATLDDVTERRHAFQAQVDTLQRVQERLIAQTRHLQGLSRIDRAIMALQPPADIAHAALVHLEAVTGCDSAAVVSYDTRAAQAVTLATRGAVPVVPERRPLDASDFLDLAWAHGADGPLMVPLVAKGLRLGSLLVTCPPGVDALSLAALESIGQVADRLAIALDNARLFEGERTARQQFQAACARLVQMQETERRRVARELHDDIGQVLTGLKLDLEAQMRQGRAHQDLEAALTTVQGLMSRVRDLSLDLRPALLDDLGLIPALIAMTERYTAQTGIQVTLDHHRAMGRLPADVETAAFRIIQESLTNIARYAGVREVYVQLETTATALELAVVDRGRGFDPLSASPHRTAGHSGMRERAAMLGGDVTIESAPGAGTAIRAALPTGVPRRRSRRRGPATGPEHR